MREYPKGTKFGNYMLCQDGPGKFSIRRLINLPDGTRLQPRHPKKLYNKLTTEAELVAYVNRLNHREDTKAKFEQELRTSFIPQSLKDEFEGLLKLEIPNSKDFRYQYNRVFKMYFLHYFVHRIAKPDPNEWHLHQAQWGASLLGRSEKPEHNVFGPKKMSAKTILKTIQIANRFMALLHLKNPTEFRLTVFNPISRAAMNAYAAEMVRTSDNKDGIGQYIDPKDWKTIDQKLPEDIAPFVRLAYHYGLRRAESLGFENLESIKKGYLKVTQQLVSVAAEGCTYQALKDREQRETPHWFCKPQDAYQWISTGLTRKIHPDTLYARWTEFMESLGMDYDLHDLRRTFITRALRDFNPRDVQMAVGHASLETTMRYAMDDRDHSDETWKPSAS
jgi:integrase